jgi:membrane protein implicated in regulation of membrane protease activity
LDRIVSLLEYQSMIEQLSPFQSQMMLVAGLVMLGWMLIRRQLRSRRRMREQDLSTRDLRVQLAKADKPTGMPLSSAPIEAQRWQVEMMDLQRDLKAELDTKIMVVQVLIRQADERIAALRQHAK